MVTKKISQSEIDFINGCLKASMRIDLVDVRLEVADHIASDIEYQWSQNPTIEFYTAYTVALKSIGEGRGIEKFIFYKKRILLYKYLRDIKSSLLEYFKLPKIFISVFLFLTILNFLDVFYFNSLLYIYFAVLIIDAFLLPGNKVSFRKGLYRKNEVTLLSIKMYRQFYFLNVFFIVFFVFCSTDAEPYLLMSFKLALFFSILLMLSRWTVMRAYVNNEIEKYGELKFS